MNVLGLRSAAVAFESQLIEQYDPEHTRPLLGFHYTWKRDK